MFCVSRCQQTVVQRRLPAQPAVVRDQDQPGGSEGLRQPVPDRCSPPLCRPYSSFTASYHFLMLLLFTFFLSVFIFPTSSFSFSLHLSLSLPPLPPCTLPHLNGSKTCPTSFFALTNRNSVHKKRSRCMCACWRLQVKWHLPSWARTCWLTHKTTSLPLHLRLFLLL